MDRAIGLAGDLYPTTTPADWDQARSWLGPQHWDAGTGMVFASSRIYAVRSAGKTILIDTGIGNGKNREQFPFFHQLDTDYLDKLTAAGVDPADVDIVVCIHLHPDRIGWNTVLRNRVWVPTFPHATYVFSQADYDQINPAHTAAADRVMFDDSIAPVVAAGLAVFWDHHHVIDHNLTVRAAPGHSPDMGIVELTSHGHHALFASDIMHSLVQVPSSQWNHSFCDNGDLATATRNRLLAGRPTTTPSCSQPTSADRRESRSSAQDKTSPSHE